MKIAKVIVWTKKQSLRCWFAKLSNALLSYGFKQSRADYSLFSLVRGKVH